MALTQCFFVGRVGSYFVAIKSIDLRSACIALQYKGCHAAGFVALCWLRTGKILMTSDATFASFWAGPPPSPYERTCLSSFVRHGYDVSLYSYESYADLPAGVRLVDASEIAPREDLDLFRYQGRPDLSHFSDYFRYCLFAKTDHIWIDADILLLKKFDKPLPPMLLAKEHANSICGAIMRIDRAQVDLDDIIARVRKLSGKKLRWGETGPQLLTTIYSQSSFTKDAFQPPFFYPILYDVFWKVYLPEEREACEKLCSQAFTLHLWNNIVVKLGVWKKLAPPEGSFLHALFDEVGLLNQFEGTYPADVLRRMIDNFRFRETGGDVAIGNLVRQLLPGAMRTARRRGWLSQAS